ncbi:MAG: S41 family peptidase [Planctomycetota bacterium]
MPKRNVVLLVVTCLVSLVALAARERGGHGRRFAEVMTAIERSYYKPVDGDGLFTAAVDAAVGRLDENSAYLRDAGRDALESALDQRFGGVGLELALDPKSRQPIVVSPVMHAPAWRAGVAAGDLVTAVDGLVTAGLPLRDTVERLRGRIGAPVTLTILPAPASGHSLDPAAAPPARDVVLLREAIEVESVQGDRRRDDGSWIWMLEGEPGVACVRITTFGERTAAELDAALEAIAAEDGLRGLVLDLRGNPGGLLQGAIDICDAFLDDGVIVATRRGAASSADDPGVLDERRATAGQRLAGLPIAVLVDGLTASAGEIVAACLQDAGRATVVGSRTFGKGTVQSLVPLSDGRGLLKLTTAEYLRPSRRTIDRSPDAGEDAAWGVRPDPGYEVTPTAEAVERLAEWRRRRDVVWPPGRQPQAAGSPALPREIDAVLAKALEAFGRDNESP